MPKVNHYVTRDGRDPFQEWLDKLTDSKARIAITRRLDRVAAGNIGDVKYLSEGVSELRIDLGPGYRIYLERQGHTVVLLLGGGDKATQQQDIAMAIQRLKDYKARTK
jgi:putative addiction module killer protein